MKGIKRQLVLMSVLMSAALLLGTLGYRWVEGWSLFDSFYMSLITLTTVGYAEVHPMSQAGRIFTSFLLMTGVTVVLAAVAVLGDLIVKLELADYFGSKRRMRMIEKLSNHYIVCGAGRVGRGVVRELRRSGADVLVIDSNRERAEWAEQQGAAVLVADSTNDETLRLARITEARGLVAAIGSDAENVYVVLAARVLNSKLLISARASNEQAEEKLKLAGAATVFTPYEFIGHRLAQSMLRPQGLSFLDMASAFRAAHLDLDVEQLKVSEASPVASATIEQSRIGQRYGVIVLAIMKGDGSMKFNPSGDTRIDAGDSLIAMGERSKLKTMELEVEVEA